MAEPRSPRNGDVSWIRARPRAAPGGTLALAALVFVTAFLAAALPRAVEGYENTALRDTVSQRSLLGRSVTMSLQVSRLSAPVDAEGLLTPPSLKETETRFQRLVKPPLTLERDQTVYGVRSVETVAADPGLPRPAPACPGLQASIRRAPWWPSPTSQRTRGSWRGVYPGPVSTPRVSKR